MIRKICLAIALLVGGVAGAWAQTAPGYVGNGQIGANYGSGYIANNWMASGTASCPSWLSKAELYLNTNSGPTSDLLQIFDGTSCVTFGTLNATAHSFTVPIAAGGTGGNTQVTALQALGAYANSETTSGTATLGASNVGKVTGDNAANVTFTLPTGFANQIFILRHQQSGTLIVGAPAGGNIFGPGGWGVSSLSLSLLGSFVALQSDGTNYGIIGGSSDVLGGAVLGQSASFSTLTDSGITGSTSQCVSASTAGLFSGSGAPCAMVLLNTLTASNSATLADTSSLTSSYSSYRLIFQNLIPATTTSQTAELLSHSGGAFPATSYLAESVANGTAAAQTTYVPVSAASTTISAVGINGSCDINAPSQTASPKNWLCHFTYYNGTSVFNLDSSGFWNGGNGAVDGFQFAFGTGNITSGVIKIYGIP